MMKPIQKLSARISAMILTMVLTLAGFAQEGGDGKTDINVDINKDGGGEWYAQPWVWIVGVAVFILLLVALLRGNKRVD
ncbi:MAG: hypothetical protein ACXWV0_07875 [Flavisolibacter sp.]